MTKKEMFEGMAEHSLDLQRALREMKLKKMGESDRGSRRNDDEGDAIPLKLIRRQAG